MTSSTKPNSSGGLHQGMRRRHLTMMGLGSAIGAGLFLGTGEAIATAGPAVLLAYLAAGVIVVLVMRMLGEMAAAYPATGSFATYAGLAFGRHARFVVGWLYWVTIIMVMGAEMTGAAAIMAQWFDIPPWIPALVCMVVFAVVNLTQVRTFGEFEFWFAFLKVGAIIAFLVIGVLLATGVFPGSDFVGTEMLLGHGGFLPNGWSGLAAGLLVVAFAFGGIEIVAIAAAESDEPETNIGFAVRSVIWRIAVFYIGSVLLIVLLLPWQDIAASSSAADSPFAGVLRLAHVPGVVGILEAIIVLSLLSAFNAQIYATSRLAYALAHQGDGPRLLARINSGGSPYVAVSVSVFFGFVAVGLQWLEIKALLSFLLNAVGATLMIVWLAIAASQIALRPRIAAAGRLVVPMWGFPVLSWGAIVALLALTALMLADPDARQQVTAAVVLVLLLAILSLVNARIHADTGPTAPHQASSPV